MTGLKRLKELVLPATITDAGMTHVSRMKALEELDLSETQVTGKGLTRLQTLTRLRKLSLPAGADDAALANLVVLPDLDELNLAFTEVSDHGLKQLQKLKGLRRLVLPNSITDQGLVHLQAVRSLRYVDATGSRVISRRGVEGLRKALPQCHVKASPNEEAGGLLF